jgi:hypothetical protein
MKKRTESWSIDNYPWEGMMAFPSSAQCTFQECEKYFSKAKRNSWTKINCSSRIAAKDEKILSMACS